MKVPIIDEVETFKRRSMPEDVKERLIVALDFPSGDEARELVQKLDGLVSFFKVGIELQLAEGNPVRDLISKGKQVLVDYKWLEIPETVERTVEQAANIGVSFVTLHGNGPIIRAAIKGRKKSGRTNPKLFTVTVLTSMDASDLSELYGYQGSVEAFVLKRAKDALDEGFDGVIASGREAGKIRELTGRKLLIVTPGIRPEGFLTDDQKRRVTPREAIVAGADYLVVGRPITRDPNPRKAAERILAEMEDAARARA